MSVGDFAPAALHAGYVTASIPGIGGTLKARPEDFLVDEIPAYSPSGKGEHLYLFVEKRNLSTPDVARILARHFGVRHEAVGYAGMKDRVAITRQLFSVHTPGRRPEDFPSLQHERVQVQWADLHDNKLRLGHLQGNRFSVRVRGVGIEKVRAAMQSLRVLEREGVPNRFGVQRFGRAMNNHLVGRAIVRGDFDGAVREMLAPERATSETYARAKEAFLAQRYGDALDALPRTAHPERNVLRALMRGAAARGAIKGLDRSTKRFYISALQSAIFNDVLRQRLSEGTLGTLREGDIAFKHDSRATFAVDRAVLDAPETPSRVGSLAISATGPMWGAHMRRPGGATLEAETAALARSETTIEELAAFEAQAPELIEASRRSLRVAVTDTQIEAGLDEHGAYIRLAFDLPRGAYATTVLDEIMKSPPASADEEEHEGG